MANGTRWRASKARLLGLAGLVLAVGCGRGCSCIEGEKVYESFDGPVPMELVRDTHWTRGKIPGPISAFAVRVATDPSFDEPVRCTEVDFAGNEEGTAVAFRCKGKERWTVLRLGDADERVRQCVVPSGENDVPDFESLGKLIDVPDQVVGCAIEERRDVAQVWNQYLRAIEKAEGSDGAVAFVSANLGIEVWATNGTDVWDEGVAGLSETAREGAHAALCTALEDPAAPPIAYRRAAIRCALDRPTHADAALAQFERGMSEHRRITKEQPNVGHDPVSRSFRALEWSAVIAVGVAPERAGQAACKVVPTIDFTRPGSRLRAELAASMLAATETACPALDGWLEHIVPCASARCSNLGDGLALCTKEQLAEEAATLKSMFEHELGGDGTRHGRPRGDLARSLLAALYARGELPPEISLRVARLDYPVEDQSGLPECTVPMEPGTACRCLHGIDHDICRIPSTETRGGNPPCALTLDDEAEVLRVESSRPPGWKPPPPETEASGQP